jgi:DNA-binding NarL/FixJ family response regulator
MGPVHRYLRTRLRNAWRAGEHSLWPDVALAAVLSLAAVWLTIRAGDVSGGGDLSSLPLPEPSDGPLPGPPGWTVVARDLVLNLLITVPLLGRRRWPLACLTVQFAGLLPFEIHVNAVTFSALLIGAYPLAVYGRSALLSMSALLVAAGVTAGVKANTWPPLPEWAGVFAILLPIGLFGVAIRAARSRARAADQRAEALEREQQAATRLAVGQERARIARELHDVVSHHVSVMTIQAGAAGKVLDADPEQAGGRRVPAAGPGAVGRTVSAGSTAGGVMTRVVIADDQTLVRTGFTMILTAADIEVVGQAANGLEAVAATRRLRPDVVLMDIRMPELDGLEATRRILAEAPTTADGHAIRVLMLTTFDLDQYVYAALTAGASGFLLKDVTPDHLVHAVRLVQQGDALLAPTITRRLVERFARVDPSRSALHRDLTTLTPREREVLTLLAGGLSNTELAGALQLSEATVKTHITRILTKLQLRDRVQAVVVAYQTGLVTPSTRRPGAR